MNGLISREFPTSIGGLSEQILVLTTHLLTSWVNILVKVETFSCDPGTRGLVIPEFFLSRRRRRKSGATLARSRDHRWFLRVSISPSSKMFFLWETSSFLRDFFFKRSRFINFFSPSRESEEIVWVPWVFLFFEDKEGLFLFFCEGEKRVYLDWHGGSVIIIIFCLVSNFHFVE